MITFRGNSSVKKAPSNHNHASDMTSVEAVKTVEAIKCRATLSDEVTSSVIQNSTSSISISAGLKLLSNDCLLKIVRLKRKVPDTEFFESVDTMRGEPFLISNDQETDLIILGTQENIRMLARYPNWFCDGTFDSAPIGYQLYTIDALLSETVTIPLVFCIAKHKNEVTYNRMFSKLKEQNASLNPETIMIDFERAALNSLTQNFPTAQIYGCFFHFGQAIWRKFSLSVFNNATKMM